jgi:hypothetical protein
MDNAKGKKPFFKRWWVWVLAVIIIVAIANMGGGDSGSKSKDTSAASPNTSTSKDTKTEETTTKDTSTASSDTSTSKDTKTEETTTKDTSTAQEKQPPSQGEIIAAQFKANYPALTDNQVELDQSSIDFIKNNYTLFPAQTDADINKVKSMTDSSIDARLLNKNPSPYFQKIASYEGTVISVEEKQLDKTTTISLTHVMDDNEQSYQVLMYKSTGNILENDRVRFWGAPVGVSSFENVSGGSTNVIDFAGSQIEKVQ